jgi:hypothetical protein
MDYSRIYNQLVARGKSRATNRKEAKELLGYVERHHIVPKCMNGLDEKDNLVFLMAREHFIAHLLLIKIYPNHPGLLLACNRLLYDKQGNKLNGKKYEVLKKKISDYRKSQNKHNNDGIARGADKRRGRNKENYEPFRIGAEKQRGRNKHTHEGPRKISEKKKGQTKDTCIGTAIMAEKLSGRTKHTHLYLREAGLKRSILTEEIKQEIIERRTLGETFSSIHKSVQERGIIVCKSAISNYFYRNKEVN